MNLIERLEEEGNAPMSTCGKAITILKNYLSQTALARGWTLDEFCSWLEDNYGEEQ